MYNYSKFIKNSDILSHIIADLDLKLPSNTASRSLEAAIETTFVQFWSTVGNADQAFCQPWLNVCLPAIFSAVWKKQKCFFPVHVWKSVLWGASVTER